jgi:hypothetical protein
MEAEATLRLLAVKEKHVQRLHVLELQAAQFGNACPPHIVTEIQDIKANIDDIDNALRSDEKHRRVLSSQFGLCVRCHAQLELRADYCPSCEYFLEKEEMYIDRKTDEHNQTPIELNYKLTCVNGHLVRDGARRCGQCGAVVVFRDWKIEVSGESADEVKDVLISLTDKIQAALKRKKRRRKTTEE